MRLPAAGRMPATRQTASVLVRSSGEYRVPANDRFQQAMSTDGSPQQEYRRLLREHGYVPPSLEEWVKTQSRLTDEARVPAKGEDIVGADTPTRERETLYLPGAFIDGTPPLNMLIGPLAEEIERAAGEWSLTLREPVHVGVFPTGEFNALARSAGHGVLLLINEGLMYFAHQSMEVFGLATTIAASGKNVGPLMSRDVAIDQLADVVYSYLWHGSSASARHLPMTGGLRGSYVDHLARNVYRFVVAHEYGHAYARHLAPANAIRLSLPSGELDVITKSWEQEFEADLVAMRLMIPPSARKVGRNSPGAFLQLVMALVGPLAFFQLDTLLEAVKKAVYGRADPAVPATHPPSAMRSARVRDWATQIRADSFLSVADQVCSWLASVQGDVANAVARRWPQP